MHLELEDFLERTGMNEASFFFMAYQAKYGRRYDVTRDVLTYQIGGIVPEYCKEYLATLNKGG